MIFELNEINTISELNNINMNKSPLIQLFPEIPAKITKLVGEACKDFNMIKKDDRILVYVTGGKDSLTLLHVLINIKRKILFNI